MVVETESSSSSVPKLLLDIISEAEKSLVEAQRRDGEFSLWIVGLSTGVISVIGVIKSISDLGRGEGFSTTLFFVLAAIMGVVHRWVLKTAITWNQQKFLEARLKLIASIGTGDEKLIKNTERETMHSNWLMPTRRDVWANRLRPVPPVLFVLGLIVLTVVLALN